jgi:hypothetical protein
LLGCFVLNVCMIRNRSISVEGGKQFDEKRRQVLHFVNDLYFMNVYVRCIFKAMVVCLDWQGDK